MGDLIRFPIVRRRAHVVLAWDAAWEEYRVEAIGRKDRGDSLTWRSEYGQAVDRGLVMAEHFGLPLVDLTAEGRGK